MSLQSSVLRPDTDDPTPDFGCRFVADGGQLIAEETGQLCRVREVDQNTSMLPARRTCLPPLGDWLLIDATGHRQTLSVSDAGVTCAAAP